MEEPSVLQVAIRLFAELGYDGTTRQLVADAAGVGVQEVADVWGDKRGLYLAAMRGAFEAEQAMLKEAVENCPPGLQCLHEVADTYLDFHADHPYIRALWMQRWMRDAADIGGLEDSFTRPLLRLVTRNVADRLPPGSQVDVPYLLSMVIWCVHGFLASGVLAHGHGLRYADDPRTRQEFRAQLHLLIDRMAG
ncbi:TetR/AcrR family transcriptional regulator [Spirillospora sp. NPDC048819]|uniref:TetR/AcrR family transcriptional regulator n=1 Tax=Spirillospora sp. NPDC048819 TaxID=3155268 RepID=UPI0033F9757B